MLIVSSYLTGLWHITSKYFLLYTAKWFFASYFTTYIFKAPFIIECFDYRIWFQYRYTDFPPPSSPSLTYSPSNEYITSFQLLTEYVLRTHMKFLWLSRLSGLSTYRTCKKCHLWVPRFLKVQRNISRMCFYNLVAFPPPPPNQNYWKLWRKNLHEKWFIYE